MRNTAATLALILAHVAAARADFSVTFTEYTSLNSVVADVVGSIDPTVVGFVDLGASGGSFGTNFYSQGMKIAPPGGASRQLYEVTPPFVTPSFASLLKAGVYVSGGHFQFDANGVFADQLNLPAGYVANTPMTSSAQWAGTFASLGITPTPFVMNLPGNQHISMNFLTVVPEPATWALVAMAAVGTSLARMVRRRNAG
jgi:hypothetical protein